LKPDSLFSKDIISGIELYYANSVNVIGGNIVLEDEEFHHAVKVMRHTQGDVLYITDGAGNIYSGVIECIEKNRLIAKVNDAKHFENKSSNIWFCFPRLKNPDRFEFALEKCVELGITNFLIFDSIRSVAKGGKAERWNKILLAAMKQSIRTYMPKLEFVGPLKKIAELSGEKIVLEQETDKNISGNITKDEKQNYYFIFGPEGGLTPDELNMFDKDSQYSLSNARLRSETAIISAAVIVTERFNRIDLLI
jgi:16S rRNA (uracil1498-N3)-methyltransferase